MTEEKMKYLVNAKAQLDNAKDALRELDKPNGNSVQGRCFSLMRDTHVLREKDWNFVRYWLAVLIRQRAERIIKMWEET